MAAARDGSEVAQDGNNGVAPHYSTIVPSAARRRERSDFFDFHDVGDGLTEFPRYKAHGLCNAQELSNVLAITPSSGCSWPVDESERD